MMYVFEVGQRVRIGLKVGEITGMVPGNGLMEWYYVTWDDGTSDRYTRYDLEVE